MKNPPRSVIAAHGLLLLNAAFWLVFALVAALGGLPGVLAGGPVRWVFAILAFGSSLSLGLLVFLLQRKNKAAFYIALVVLVLIGTLSITDEIGILDVLTMLISLGAAVLLLINRSWYLNPGDPDR